MVVVGRRHRTGPGGEGCRVARGAERRRGDDIILRLCRGGVGGREEAGPLAEFPVRKFCSSQQLQTGQRGEEKLKIFFGPSLSFSSFFALQDGITTQRILRISRSALFRFSAR